jgi:hypothetical protein
MFYTESAAESTNIWAAAGKVEASEWNDKAYSRGSSSEFDSSAESQSISQQWGYRKPTTPLCRFFALGNCAAGESCRFSHAICFEDASDDLVCGICSENVLLKGRKFGLLENCDDVFCLDCLREWRNQKEKQDKANLRRCPLCRLESFVVIPSASFLVGDQKRTEKEKYCNYLSSIPCKNFDQGKGKCPFGSSCLYKHDGEVTTSDFIVIKGADGKKTKKATQLSEYLRL